MSASPIGDKLRSAVAAIAGEVQSSLGRNPERTIEERDLWYELSCCILSSQVRYEVAAAYASEIDRQGLLQSPACRDDTELETTLRTVLSAPIQIDGRWVRYRFPRSRAAQLTLARRAVIRDFVTLKSLLGHATPSVIRSYMVREVAGLGPKQSSMFLRNVGTTYDMAVIDGHVRAYMEVIGLGLPTAVLSLKGYERHEKSLRREAEDAGYEVGVFDWAIWVVMRAAKDLEAIRVS